MPFNKDYQYSANTEGVTHASVPPSTRCCGPREYAVIYIKDEPIGVAQRLIPEERIITRAEVFKENAAKVVPDFTQKILEEVPFDMWLYKLDNTLIKYKECKVVYFHCTYDAGTKFVYESSTFTFKSSEESSFNPQNVLK